MENYVEAALEQCMGRDYQYNKSTCLLMPMICKAGLENSRENVTVLLKSLSRNVSNFDVNVLAFQSRYLINVTNNGMSISWLHASGKEPSVRIVCEHQKVVAELWHQGGLLHRLDGPAEIYRGCNYRWHIDGKLLPDFDDAVVLGEAGIASYISKNPDLRNPIIRYLRERYPYGQLLQNLMVAEAFLEK